MTGCQTKRTTTGEDLVIVTGLTHVAGKHATACVRDREGCILVATYHYRSEVEIVGYNSAHGRRLSVTGTSDVTAYRLTCFDRADVSPGGRRLESYRHCHRLIGSQAIRSTAGDDVVVGTGLTHVTGEQTSTVVLDRKCQIGVITDHHSGKVESVGYDRANRGSIADTST